MLVVGSSVGGWIVSDLAFREHRRISGTVLLDAVGIDVEGIELADFFSLFTTAAGQLTWFHDPAAAPDPTQLPPEGTGHPGRQRRDARGVRPRARLHARSQAATTTCSRPDTGRRALGRERPYLPEVLRPRVRGVIPPTGRFQPIPEAGHLPHLEQPELVLQGLAPLRRRHVTVRQGGSRRRRARLVVGRAHGCLLGPSASQRRQEGSRSVSQAASRTCRAVSCGVRPTCRVRRGRSGTAARPAAARIRERPATRQRRSAQAHS